MLYTTPTDNSKSKQDQKWNEIDEVYISADTKFDEFLHSWAVKML